MEILQHHWLRSLPGIAVVGLALSLAANAQIPYYVDAGRPDDSGDGLTWGTAKQTIQAAIDLTAAGDTVWVTNGTYTVTAQVSVTNGITLRSVNGSDHTIIHKTTNIRNLFIDHPDAVVDGFRLTSGHTGQTWDFQGFGAHIARGTLRGGYITGQLQNRGTGGGVYLGSGEAVLTHSLVTDCGSKGVAVSGGGVYADGGLVTHCIIRNSTSGSGAGGGVRLAGGAVLRNSLVVSNQTVSHHGGGLYMDGSASRVENCTIVRNHCGTGQGGGVYINGGAMVNTIVYLNTAPEQPGTENTAMVSGGMTYTCTTPKPAGDGNIDDDPLFADQDGGDYRLGAGSPAINTGTNQAWMGSATDLAGRARIIGGTADMGAYEYETGPLACSLEATPTTGTAPLTAVLTAAVDGTNLVDLVYRWDFGDNGVIDIEGPQASVVTNTFDAGWHAIRLTVENAASELATQVRAAYIRSSPLVTHVSSAGSNVPPYATWDAAAHAIQPAVDAVAEGGTVLVADGTYTVTEQINIFRPLTLRSVNGWSNTVVRKTTHIRCFYIDHADALIDGFSIVRDGGTPWFNGGGVYIHAGVMTHCMVRGHIVGNNSGGQVYLATAEAVLTHSIVENSDRSGGTIYGSGVYANGGRIVNCIIRDNITVSAGLGSGLFLTGGAVARNSLITGNHHNGSGGGVYITGADSRIENCTIVNNQSINGQGGGVYRANGTVTNSIIYLNTAPANVSTDNWMGGGLSYTCTTPLPDSGEGNTAGDPQFVDVDDGDYRLLPGSPAINTGTNQTWMGSATDLDGRARIIGLTVDMGAYEYEPGPLACSFDADIRRGPAPLTVVLTASTGGTYTGGLIYRWDFGNDGVVDIEGPDARVITNVFDIGSFDIRLTVENAAAETATRLRHDYILATPKTNYVCLSGSHTPPYDTWGKAANDIQSAVDAVDDNATVIVNDGVYTVPSQINILKPLTLRSVNGWSNTTVRKTANIRCFYVEHAGAVIDGFSIVRDSGTPWINGGGVYIHAGVMTHCVVRDHVVGNNSGGQVYLATADAVLTHSIIEGGFRNGGTIYGGGVYANGGRVINCIIRDVSISTAGHGGGLYLTGGAVARNNLITGNHHNGSGGGVYITGADSLFVNGTVVTNSAGTGGGVSRANGEVRNSIIVFNTATTSSNYHGAGLTYSCTTPAVSGDGNIDDDPLFADAAGGDYRLQKRPIRSPGIDAGTNQVWMIGATDLDGNPRIRRGRIHEALPEIVDMGAYEFQPPQKGVFLLLK